MGRKKSLQPAYRLHRSSGNAIVTLDGRDVYLGRHGTPESRRRYHDVLADWLAGTLPSTPTKPDPDDIAFSVVELIDRFLHEYVLVEYMKHGRPTSEQATMKTALSVLKDHYGDVAVEAFGPKALKAVRDVMVGKGWCRKYVNQQIHRLKFCFRWGVSEELVPPEVSQKLDAVLSLAYGRARSLGVRESEPIKPVSDAYVDAIRPHVSPQVWAMVELQRLTGMRPGEAVIMRGCDIDTTGELWIYRPSEHKTEHHGKDRAIYLGPKAQAVIRPFMKHDLQAYLFSPRDAVRELRKACMCHRRPNQKANVRKSHRCMRPRYDVDSYRRAISRACDLAFPVPTGEKADAWQREHRWHPNRLRHTAATRLRKVFGIEAARVVLGHSSARTTEIYAELDQTRAADAMAKIG